MIDVQHLLLLQVLGGHLWMTAAALLLGIALLFNGIGNIYEPCDCNIDLLLMALVVQVVALT